MTYLSCPDHKPVQHRDAKPPWCDECGLTADYQIPVAKFGKEQNYVAIQIKTTHSLSCPLSDLTAEVLKNFLQDVPSGNRVSVSVSHGDRPGEISTVRFEAETTGSQVSHHR